MGRQNEAVVTLALHAKTRTCRPIRGKSTSIRVTSPFHPIFHRSKMFIGLLPPLGQHDWTRHVRCNTGYVPQRGVLLCLLYRELACHLKGKNNEVGRAIEK